MRITYASLPSPDQSETDRYLNASLAGGYLAAYARSIRGSKDTHTLLTPDQLTDLSPAQITCSILSTAPQLAALSVYNWNRQLVMDVSRGLHDIDPVLPIVLGGPEVAFDPISALLESGAGWVCTGEGEIPFVSLLDHLDDNPCESRSLPGMISRDDPHPQDHANAIPACLVDPLDAIPSPYTSNILTPQPGSTVDLETMRGCPFKCGFCLYGKNYGQTRYFSLERVRADLAHLLGSEAASIYIIDPTFNLPRQRCLDICSILKDLNPRGNKKIFVEVKAEYTDDHMADAFVDAGIAAVEVGLQTTNPAALKLMGRKFQPASFIRGMHLLREREIWANVGVIAGLPGDNAAHFKETLQFVSEQALGRLLIYPLQVFPGCSFQRHAQQLGLKFEFAPSYQVTETPLISSVEMKQIVQSIPDLVEEMNQPYLREMSRLLLNRLRVIQDTRISMPESSGMTVRSGSSG